MNYQSILEKLKKHFLMADIYFQETTNYSIELENNHIQNISTNQKQGFSVRSINKESQEGFISFYEFDDKNLDKLLYLSQMGEIVEYQLPYYYVEDTDKTNYCKSVQELTLEQITKECYTVLERLQTYNASFEYSLGFSYGFENSQLYNTLNSQYKKQSSYFAMSIKGIKASDNDILQYSKSFVRKGYSFDHAMMEKNFIQVLDYFSLPYSSLSKGFYPVIFSPEALQSIISILLTSFDGSIIEQGTSTIPSQIGQQIADSSLSLYNDATHPELLSSSLYDDEGVLSSSFPLIEKGICYDGFYHLKTASKLGKKSTGNGLRSFTQPPYSSVRNLIIQEGNENLASMIKSLNKGVYIDRLVGAGMSNHLTGELSGSIALGYVINQGEITSQLKNAMVHGNIFEMLKKIIAISSERFQGAQVLYPYILFDSIHIVT